MIVILHGTERTLIDSHITQYTLSEKIDNIIKFDYPCEIEDIINEASYVSLFDDKKLIVVNNAEFLTNSKEDNAAFLKYAKNENDASIIFLVLDKEKLSDRNKLVSLINSNNNLYEYNKLSNKDLYYYVRELLKKEGYTIEEDAIRLFLNLINNEIKLIDKELEKLMIYKIDEKNIIVSDVEEVVSRNIEGDIFELVSAVVKKDTESIFKVFKNLLKVNTEPIYIVSMLSAKFRLLLQVKILVDSGLSKDSIATKLKSHPYPIMLAMESVKNYNKDALTEIILSLFDLDMQMKTSNLDKTKLLENFFLGI